jgi:hypothetical protein
LFDESEVRDEFDMPNNLTPEVVVITGKEIKENIAVPDSVPESERKEADQIELGSLTHC